MRLHKLKFQIKYFIIYIINYNYFYQIYIYLILLYTSNNRIFKRGLGPIPIININYMIKYNIYKKKIILNIFLNLKIKSKNGRNFYKNLLLYKT
jgi:hypothetical protein